MFVSLTKGKSSVVRSKNTTTKLIKHVLPAGSIKVADSHHITTGIYNVNDYNTTYKKYIHTTVPNQESTASETTSSSTTVPIANPTNEEVARFVTSMDNLTLGARVETLTTLQSATAAYIRDQESSNTFTRQFAHTILTRDIIGIEDIYNPARNWMRTYDDFLKEKSSDTTSNVASNKGRSKVTYYDTTTTKNTEADAAFGIDSGISITNEPVDNTKTLTGLTSSSSSSSTTSSASKSRSSDTDISPPIGGAISLISVGSLAPSTTPSGNSLF